MSLCRRKYSRIVYGFCRYRWNMCTEGNIFGKGPVFPDNSDTHPSLAGIAGNAGINGMGIMDPCSSFGRRTLLAGISNNGGIGTYEKKANVMTQEELNKKLLDAVRINNISEVEEAMSLGADVNSADDDGWTPLIYAAYCGNTDITILLLKYRTNINAVNKYGDTALMMACWNGYIDIAELLIEHGADVNAVDNMGRSALGFAYRNGYTDIVNLLLKSGADPDIKDNDGNTALMYLAREGDLNSMKLLAKAGADLNIRNSEGQTAFEILKEKYPEKYRNAVTPAKYKEHVRQAKKQKLLKKRTYEGNIYDKDNIYCI